MKDLSIKFVEFFLLLKDAYEKRNLSVLLKTEIKENIFVTYVINKGDYNFLFIKNIINERTTKM